jgi:GT2 family glycosyltransferase
MKIGYICTNYNNSSVTQHAIESLSKNTSHEIISVVVDNFTSEEARNDLAKIKLAGVDIVYLDSNVGYFAGLNAGIRHLRAIRPDIEWLVVGNNDLEFPEDFGDKLAAIAPEIRKFPVISPDIVTMDGEHQNPHVISKISKVRELFYDLYFTNYYVGLLLQNIAMKFRRLSDRSDEQEWQQPRFIYQGHGSVYILSPRFFELFTELWAPTFLMSEEFFLSKQLMDVGERVYYDPRLTIRHLWHASLDQLPGRRRWEMARDAHREYRKYIGVFSDA